MRQFISKSKTFLLIFISVICCAAVVALCLSGCSAANESKRAKMLNDLSTRFSIDFPNDAECTYCRTNGVFDVMYYCIVEFENEPTDILDSNRFNPTYDTEADKEEARNEQIKYFNKWLPSQFSKLDDEHKPDFEQEFIWSDYGTHIVYFSETQRMYFLYIA